MRAIVVLASALCMTACAPKVPTDTELRLAATSELRKLKLPEAEQANVNSGSISNVRCQGTDEQKVCSFSIGNKLFKKSFARSGTGAWSAYER